MLSYFLSSAPQTCNMKNVYVFPKDCTTHIPQPGLLK